MKIVMFLNASFPSDIRVEKEASALLESDFEVHLVCARKIGEQLSEVVDGIHVHRIDSPALDQKKENGFMGCDFIYQLCSP